MASTDEVDAAQTLLSETRPPTLAGGGKEPLPDDGSATDALVYTNKPATNGNCEPVPAQRPTKSRFGGLIGSSSTLRPFKSPVPRIALQSSQVDAASPAKRAKLSCTSTPSRTSGVATSIGHLRSSNSASKPFRSPFSKVAALNSNGVKANQPTDACDMTSLRLAAALPALERKLAMLKSAKRNISARERGLESADNTDRIRELSQKWLFAGREAAEGLWSQMKVSYSEDADQVSVNKRLSTFDSGFNSWGWAKPPSEMDEKQARIETELDAMTEEERNEVYRHVEIEDGRVGLPTITQILEAKASKMKDTSMLFFKAGKYQDMGIHQGDDSDNDHETVEANAYEELILDGPPPAEKATGMARMLQGCGIP